MNKPDSVALEDGERPRNATEYEAICEFVGRPDARRTPAEIVRWGMSVGEAGAT